jgi:hypothetical protein
MVNKHMSGYLIKPEAYTSQTPQHNPAKLNLIKPEAYTI